MKFLFSQMISKYLHLVLLVSLTMSCSKAEKDSSTKILWNGDIKTFVKEDNTDPNISDNQDRITSNVWITRDNDGGQIYNIAKESEADLGKSPIGTEWAIGTLDQLDDLEFRSFRSAQQVRDIKPRLIVGKDMILHLIDQNIYLSIKFTSWSNSQKGGFAYERSTP